MPPDHPDPPDEPSTFAVIAGGGTAGHVLPGLAIGRALVDAGHPAGSIRFVGFRASGRFGLGFDNFVACTSNPFTTSSESPEAAGVPTLHPNYPNPFATTTTIGYELAAPGRVRLTVYDLLGREVATLVDGARPAGRHTVSFDARGLASGAYIYRIHTSAFMRSALMTVSR